MGGQLLTENIYYVFNRTKTIGRKFIDRELKLCLFSNFQLIERSSPKKSLFFYKVLL